MERTKKSQITNNYEQNNSTVIAALPNNTTNGFRQSKETSPELIKEALNLAVDAVVEHKEKYVRNPNGDFTRNRKISMKEVINLILTMEGGSLNREIYKYGQLTGKTLSSAGFVQQRNKIMSSAFQAIFQHFNARCADNKTYRGYSLLAVDGSDVNQYRNPETDTFVRNSSNPHGYNQTHLNALYDLCNKTYIDVELQPRPTANEHKALLAMLYRNTFQQKTIILADRGYESYNTFAHLLEKKVNFLFRVKNGSGAMAAVKKLPMENCDEDVTIEISTSQTKEDKEKGRRFIQTGSKKGRANSPNTIIQQWDFASPYTMCFRIVRFMLEGGEYETIATTLSRDEFPAEEIKNIYHLRWGIETSFRELKYNIGLTNLHCKKEDFARQEIYAALIMYNFCSRLSGIVSIIPKAKCMHQYKLNFAMAIYLCRRYYRHCDISSTELLHKLICYVAPVRPSRRDKRKMKIKTFVGFVYRVAA